MFEMILEEDRIDFNDPFSVSLVIMMHIGSILCLRRYQMSPENDEQMFGNDWKHVMCSEEFLSKILK